MPLRFFGACEVRQIETGTQQWPLPTDFISSSCVLVAPPHSAAKEETHCSSKPLRTGESSERTSAYQNGRRDAKEGTLAEEATLTSMKGAAAPQQQAQPALRTQLITLHRFRIIDYVYSSRVIQKVG